MTIITIDHFPNQEDIKNASEGDLICVYDKQAGIHSIEDERHVCWPITHTFIRTSMLEKKFATIEAEAQKRQNN